MAIMFDMTVKDRLTELAQAAGYKNPSELARLAGVTEGAMRQHINRDRIPEDAGQKYAYACRDTGVTPEWVRFGKGEPPVSVLLPVRSAKKVQTEIRTNGRFGVVTGDVDDPRAARSPQVRDLPVYQATDIGGGIVSISPEPIDFGVRPEFATPKESFTLNVVTDLMANAAMRGDRIQVSPLHPARDGDLVLLLSGPPEDRKGIFRELVKVTDTHWKVKQYNPPKEETFDRKTWPDAYKVESVQKR